MLSFPATVSSYKTVISCENYVKILKVTMDEFRNFKVQSSSKTCLLYSSSCCRHKSMKRTLVSTALLKEYY